MTDAQKELAEGLEDLARKVREGYYGPCDEPGERDVILEDFGDLFYQNSDAT